MAVKVGSTIYVFDSDRRVYTDPAKGRLWGRIIWRGHWRPVTVESETRVSWVTSAGKCPKKNHNPRAWSLSSAEVDEKVYVHDHARHIARLVEDIGSAATLRQIAQLVGYVEKDHDLEG